MKRCILVRFEVEAFHHWPGAEGKRAYLGQRHRHMMHVEVSLAVFHNDRDVEFHDLRDFCLAHMPAGEWGSTSCETAAIDLAKDIRKRWPDRAIAIGVFEDGECGGFVSYSAEEPIE